METIKPWTKTILTFIGTACAIYQVPGVHDIIAPFLNQHHTVASVISALMAVYLTLHNPKEPRP